MININWKGSLLKFVGDRSYKCDLLADGKLLHIHHENKKETINRYYILDGEFYQSMVIFQDAVDLRVCDNGVYFAKQISNTDYTIYFEDFKTHKATLFLKNCEKFQFIGDNKLFVLRKSELILINLSTKLERIIWKTVSNFSLEKIVRGCIMKINDKHYFSSDEIVSWTKVNKRVTQKISHFNVLLNRCAVNITRSQGQVNQKYSDYNIPTTTCRFQSFALSINIQGAIFVTQDKMLIQRPYSKILRTFNIKNALISDIVDSQYRLFYNQVKHDKTYHHRLLNITNGQAQALKQINNQIRVSNNHIIQQLNLELMIYNLKLT